jgi:uncharacterized protein (DUF433 family)
VLTGEPVICEPGFPSNFIIGLMAHGWSETDILTNYPGIEHEDIIACLDARRMG